MQYELDYYLLKNFIFPLLDLLFKLLIGIFLALYLFQRGKKDRIKDLIIESFLKIREELGVLRRIRYENNVQFMLTLVSREPLEISFFDSLNPSLNSTKIASRYKDCIEIDTTGQETINNIYKHLNRLELLLGVKTYEATLKGLEDDLKKFLSKTLILYNTDSQIFANTSQVVNDHYKAFRDNLLTKGEYSMDVFKEAGPLFEEIDNNLKGHWDNLIYPHLSSLRKTIHYL